MTLQHPIGPEGISPYEQRRWAELQEHWKKANRPRQIMPATMRTALSSAGGHVVDVSGRAARRLAASAPEPVRNAAEAAIDATLVPTVNAVVHLLELVTEWSVELTDQERVLQHHRECGRNVSRLEDLQALDLEMLDEVTHRMSLRWRSLGAAEGAAIGALAFIPAAGGLAAISLDVLIMHVLSASIATRAAHAYGFDPASPQTAGMIDRMVQRSYGEQAVKVGTQRKTGSAFAAAAGRKNWSRKLREDHKVLAAVEKLMKQANNGAHVPIDRVAKAMPAVSMIVGAGTNSHVLADIAKQSINYAQTVLLAQKHGLPLPTNLHDRNGIQP